MKSPQAILSEEIGERGLVELAENGLLMKVKWAMIRYKDQFKNEGIRESEKKICGTCHYGHPHPTQWPCSDCKRHNKWKSKSGMERT